MAVLGIWLYSRILRLAAPHLPRGTPLLICYLAAGAVACTSVVFFSEPQVLALREAAQESLLAPIGLLFLLPLRTSPSRA